MKQKRVNENKKPFVIFLIVISVIFFSIGVAYNYQKIKQSSYSEDFDIFNLIISKEEAVETAKIFLVSNNLLSDPESYEFSLAKSIYQNEYAFIERTFGKVKVNDFIRLYNLSYSIYSVRFFKELEKEEFLVSIDEYTGKVVDFTAITSETKDYANNSLTKEDAKEKALSFLKSRGFDTAKLEDRDYSADKINERTDHSFTFKIKDSDFESNFGKSHIEVKITITGDIVSDYSTYVFVPEEFSRQITKQLNSGTFLAILSVLATLLMFVLALVVLIRGFIKKKVSWKFFLILSLIFVAFSILNIFNSYPVIKDSYPTESPYLVFVGTMIVISIIVAILSAILVFVTGASGEYLARDAWKEKISDLSEFLKGKFLSKETSYSILRGYLIAMFFFGLTSLMYFIGERYFGVWYLNSSDNTFLFYFPAFSVFVVSLFTASIAEEFTYRLFGITFFKKYFKSTFLAVLIPTIIWAVAHSAYPTFPFYFRAIELLITGILFSYFFLKYNLTAVITAHYLYDAILLGAILLISGDVFFLISEIFILILPLIIAIAGLVKK